MNNEPVAWYAEKNDGEMVFATSKAERGYLENKSLEVIPLYTHPAKTLTDEELVAHVPLMAWEVFSSSLFMLENNEITNDEFIKRCYEVVKARCNHPQPDYTQFNTQSHPFKTLTDEEAYQIFSEAACGKEYDFKAGVRAILRKAQEK